MMGRRPIVDPDIDFDRLRSNIIKELVHRMDSYYSPEEEANQYMFCDVQNRFVVGMTDDCCTYAAKGYGIRVPLLKFLYVPKHCRGKGIQKMFLEYIISVAEEKKESFATMASAFEIQNAPICGTASQYMLCILKNPDEEMDDWLYQTTKQRQRLLDLGFRNVRYEHGEVTLPWQQLYYMHTNATAEQRMIIDNLELHYDVQWDKLRKTQIAQ
tara:strand:+ start:355 stop:993 length:639 start_codon:yes stop_codon:yes gene_type:complete